MLSRILYFCSVLAFCLVTGPETSAADKTPGCGGKGTAPCEYAKTKKVGRASKLGCGGKDVYWSPLKGGCWECPEGYDRTWHALTGKKACKKGKGFKRAAEVYSYWGCPDGEFHRLVKGYGHACYTCGAAYKRTLSALDSSKACKVRKGQQCDGSLVPRTHVNNGELVTRCGNAFDMKAEAKKARQESGELINAAAAMIWEISKPGGVGKDFRAAVKAEDWNQAQNLITGTETYENKIRPLGVSTTFGVYGDASMGTGGNGEIGIAVNPPYLMPYATYGIQGDGVAGSKRLSASADAGVVVGFWFVNGEEMLGSSFGLAYGVSLVAAPSVTVWWSDNGKDDLIGLQVALGAGIGIEWAELNFAETVRLN